MWCSSFFTPSFPTSFVGEYGNSDCPSLDAWKVLAACGFNCRSTLVMQHLEFSHSPFYRCTACQLLTTCMTLECRSWDTSSVFLLDLGSSPGRYPDPQYGDSPAGSLHMKPKAWIIKTQGSPRVTETWAWVLSYKVKEMGWAAFRQKRGLNPAHHTPWARTSVLFCTFWVQKFPPFWMVVERLRKYSFSQLVQTRKIGENILCTSQWSLLMA